MTTRDHLIYYLQDIFAFHRDYLPLLDAMRHEAAGDELRRVLAEVHESMKVEMETLERALNLLGARIKMEHSVLDAGLKEARQRFKRQLSPSREQLGIHSLLWQMQTAQMTLGAYRGSIELARVLGEQDVVKLLEENAQRQEENLAALVAQAPRLIQEVSYGETRKAA